jgi:hydrogenase-4 component E
MNPAILTAIVDQTAIVLLIAVLFQTATHRLATSVGVVVVQGVLLTIVAVAVALENGHAEAWVGVVLTAAVRIAVVPVLLIRALDSLRVKVENDPVLPSRAMVAIGVGLVLVAYQIAGVIPLPGPLPSRHVLPTALALMLVGMFLMIARRKALSQVIALITIENGIALAALAATDGMPIAVELGLSFDILIAVTLMVIILGRIHASMGGSTNVDRQNRLRDRREGSPYRASRPKEQAAADKIQAAR